MLLCLEVDILQINAFLFISLTSSFTPLEGILYYITYSRLTDFNVTALSVCLPTPFPDPATTPETLIEKHG